MTLRALVDWAEARLRAAPLAYGHGTDNVRDEAAWLVLHATGHSPVDVSPDPESPVGGEQAATARALVERRVREGRPAAYLTGRAWFAGLEFSVDERVLVPRSPLAEPIAERFEPWLDGPVARILEVGTGCGCIAVACARAFPEARVDATDLDPGALEVARSNVGRHGLSGRVRVLCADVYEGLPAARYDLIVSNPPYVDAARMAALPREYRHEPATALAAGADGLEVVTRIIDDAAAWLTPRGLLVIEVGATAGALQSRYPRLPFTWLEFEQGGDGVLVLEAAALTSA